MEAGGDGYVGRTPIPHSSKEISDLGYSNCSFSRRCLHHHFPVGGGGASWTKWEAQSRGFHSQTPQELLKLQKSQSKPIPPPHCRGRVKQHWGVKDFQPVFAISWAGRRCVESCWDEMGPQEHHGWDLLLPGTIPRAMAHPGSSATADPSEPHRCEATSLPWVPASAESSAQCWWHCSSPQANEVAPNPG